MASNTVGVTVFMFAGFKRKNGYEYFFFASSIHFKSVGKYSSLVKINP